MVQPEGLLHVRMLQLSAIIVVTYRVCGRGVDVLHDGANAVVAPGVSTALRAASHVGESGARVAGVDHRRAGVDGLSGIVVASQAVRLIACARTNVDGEVGELLYSKSVG